MVAFLKTIPRTATGALERTLFYDMISKRYRENNALFKDYFFKTSDDLLEITAILFDLHADFETLFATLLLNEAKADPALFTTFPETKIAKITKGVLSLSRLYEFETAKANSAKRLEGLRRMFLAMVNDIRIVLIKLAECTVLLRQAKTLPLAEQQQIGEAVLTMYAPLANRLGIGQLKWELEDRAFHLLQPQEYQLIAEKLHEKREEREIHLQKLLLQIKALLEKHGIDTVLEGRVKHIYSIWRKMQKKALTFDDLFDIRAIRILVRDVASCYNVLALIHEQFTPLVSEYTDYIVTPKENGYRSLHTVIRDPDDKAVEIQIRTFSMHEEAEKGVAAHWRYKEGARKQDVSINERVNWLRSLLAFQKEIGASPAQYEELANERVYVFTPAGDVVDLPKGATPLDFAYEVHTEVGHRCKGAKVNGKMVPLNYILNTGEQVEILTHKIAQPSRDWLRAESGYLHISKAIHRLRAYFRSKFEKTGKESSETLTSAAAGNKLDENIIKAREPSSAANHQGILVENVNNLLSHPAKCCQPVIGDDIIGYITQGKGVAIHRSDCTHVLHLPENRRERLIAVTWGTEKTAATYPVSLLISGSDHNELLKEVAGVLAAEKVRVSRLNHWLNKEDKVNILLMLEVSRLQKLNDLRTKLLRLPGVFSVERSKQM